jgi:hypothetical protein
MAMLPQEEDYLRPLSPKEIVLNEIPISFTRKEAVDLAMGYGLSAKQVDRMIEQLLDNEELIRTAHGQFRFNDNYDR